MKKGYKKCPYCSEEIKKEAIKCRYCGEFILKNNVTQENAELNNKFGKDTISCKKRFGKYILYLLRDRSIYIIFRIISYSFEHNIYSPDIIDLFICFLIFIFETVNLIIDCIKIKKGTYGNREYNGKKYKCNGCGQIVKSGDKKCSGCGKNLSWLEIEKKEGVKISKKLLLFIPNAFILYTYLYFFLGFLGGLFPLMDPYYYTQPIYNQYIPTFLVGSVVVSLFLLFVPTKKARYSLSIKRIILCFIASTTIYIYNNDSIQHQKQKQKIQEIHLQNEGLDKAAQEMGYPNWSSYMKSDILK